MDAFSRKVIEFFGIIHPLDRIARAGYVLRGVPHPESVSAHSHFLAVLALLYLERHPENYDREKVLIMALIHDLSEARLMDIPMPYADAYLKDAKAHAEQKIMEHLFGDFSERYAAWHEELTIAQTPESQLVRALDKVQMMIKVLYYEKERAGNLEEFWENPANFRDYALEPVSALFDAICEEAGRTRPRFAP